MSSIDNPIVTLAIITVAKSNGKPSMAMVPIVMRMGNEHAIMPAMARRKLNSKARMMKMNTKVRKTVVNCVFRM